MNKAQSTSAWRKILNLRCILMPYVGIGNKMKSPSPFGLIIINPIGVHAASLIHDDLPCIDDDPSRRGQPSSHTIYSVDMAILAGDALFPLGFRHIVSQTPSDLVPEPCLLRFLDLEGGPNSVDFVQENIYGEMAECSALCGGLLGGAKDEEIRRLRRYGRAVGVLYQVVEDRALSNLSE
ncbi:hypothetical protein ACJRO7_021986 [Eucalyptus globulus]|uniref:Uncharacterized protein n=1 Tax=Eucalyptus globulus TaxID=34317 RepID=A0ABD3KN29_EUCGL